MSANTGPSKFVNWSHGEKGPSSITMESAQLREEPCERHSPAEPQATERTASARRTVLMKLKTLWKKEWGFKEGTPHGEKEGGNDGSGAHPAFKSGESIGNGQGC